MRTSISECDRIELAIAAGGTAGHINPAIALADEMTSRGHHVTFFGQRDKLEGKLVPEAGYELHDIEVAGFDRTEPWTLVPAVHKMWKAFRFLKSEFSELNGPDVAIGFGAYVELPLLIRCQCEGIPYLIHEQNSVPGLANKLMASRADAVAMSVPGSKEGFLKFGASEDSIVMTGNPVRRSITQASRDEGRQAYGLSDAETMLLVFGGSLGARHVNEALAGIKEKILSSEGVHVVHATGKMLYDEVVSSLALTESERSRWEIVPYIDDMGKALAAADLVISRAGASSVAEIAATAVPAILVPYPLATGDHQTMNAKALTNYGAAVLVPDSELQDDSFGQVVLELLGDEDRRASMRLASRQLGGNEVTRKLADQIETVLGQR